MRKAKPPRAGRILGVSKLERPQMLVLRGLRAAQEAFGLGQQAREQ